MFLWLAALFRKTASGIISIISENRGIISLLWFWGIIPPKLHNPAAFSRIMKRNNAAKGEVTRPVPPRMGLSNVALPER